MILNFRICFVKQSVFSVSHHFIGNEDRPNPKYSMTNYYYADKGKDCLDLWGK